VIAKITRGGSAAGLAAYLHGPGAGTEHTTEVDGRQVPGGAVVASNVPGVQVGDLDGRRWGRWLDRAAASRPEIKGPVWHCSLNLAPGDRALTRQEWADAATGFVQRMGIPSGHPWAAVQHDDRGIHIAVSRVNDTGRVWHARHDRRTAQKARQALEREYRLTEAPIRKTGYGAVLPEPPAVGVHTVAGDTWRVRSRDGRAVTDRLGRDGRWRLVTNGMRTLRIALARTRDPDSLTLAERIARHRAASFPAGHSLTQTAPDPLRERSYQPPTRQPDRGRGRGR